MSKKKINIALIIVVLALWGTVAYKAVSQYFFPKELLAVNDGQTNVRLNFSQIKKDVFQIENIQSVPFLNKREEPLTQNVVVRDIISPPKINKPVIVPKPAVQWPAVYYYGYIKSKDKTEELILVKINNQLHKLRKNDQVDGLVIKKVYSDSIEVYFNKEKKIIKH